MNLLRLLMSSSLIAFFTFLISFIASVSLDKVTFEKVFLINYLIVLGSQLLILGKNYSIYKSLGNDLPLSFKWFLVRYGMLAILFPVFWVLDSPKKWLLLSIVFVVFFQLYACYKRVVDELYKSVFYEKLNQITCSILFLFLLLGYSFQSLELSYFSLLLFIVCVLLALEYAGLKDFTCKIKNGYGEVFNSYELKVSIGVFTLLLVNVVDKIFIGYFYEDGVLAAWLVNMQVYFVLSILAQSIFSYFIKEDGGRSKKTPLVLFMYAVSLLGLASISTFLVYFIYDAVYGDKYSLDLLVIFLVNLSGGVLIFQQVISSYIITELSELKIKKVNINSFVISLFYLFSIVFMSRTEGDFILKIAVSFFLLSIFKLFNSIFYYYQGDSQCTA